MMAPAASASDSARARWAAATGSVMPPRATSLAELLRAVAQRVEIGHDIGAILGLGQAGEGHLGALGERLRVVEPLVELFNVPFLALMRAQRRRERVAVAVLGDRRAQHAIEIGPDAIRAALLEGVAGHAFLRLLLAGIDAGIGEQRRDRLGTLLLLAALFLGRLGAGDDIGRLRQRC